MKHLMKWAMIATLFVGAREAHAQTQCVANPTTCSTSPTGATDISLTISRVIKLTVTPTSTTLITPTVAHYNAGYAATTGPTGTLKANSGWNLAISASTSTWSATDTQATEPARTNKPASDLTWSTSSTGTFTGLTTTPVTVASGASATAGSTVSLFYRTLYAWGLDTPGNYSLQVVFTITAP